VNKRFEQRIIRGWNGKRLSTVRPAASPVEWTALKKPPAQKRTHKLEGVNPTRKTAGQPA